jgi:hypothetical protein
VKNPPDGTGNRVYGRKKVYPGDAEEKGDGRPEEGKPEEDRISTPSPCGLILFAVKTSILANYNPLT